MANVHCYYIYHMSTIPTAYKCLPLTLVFISVHLEILNVVYIHCFLDTFFKPAVWKCLININYLLPKGCVHFVKRSIEGVFMRDAWWGKKYKEGSIAKGFYQNKLAWFWIFKLNLPMNRLFFSFMLGINETYSIRLVVVGYWGMKRT